jgi:DNA modification methylase
LFNQIHNMDCLEGMNGIPDNFVDLIFTSPPYFNVKDYSFWSSYDEYLDWLLSVMLQCNRVLKDGRMLVVNISSIIIPRKSRSDESSRLALPFHFVCMLEKIGFKFIEDIIWVKPDGSSKNRNGSFYQHRQPVAYKPNVVNEYVFVFQKDCNFLIDKVVRGYKGEIKEKSLVKESYERTNIWFINPETKSKHPAPFPVELSDKIIKYYSYVEDVVLDPFMGSGTTAISCIKNNRRYIGYEIHKKYIDIFKKRIKQYD